MKSKQRKILSLAITLALVFSLISVLTVGSNAASAGITDAKGWFESAYAEWSPVSGADGYNAYVAPAGSSSWTKIDKELVRNYPSYYRVDAVGLKAGDYQIKIVPTVGGAEQAEKALTTDTLTVLAYDRSGFAHFNNTEGVGAYNDDGTLKDNAIVLYVTNENKNTVSVTSKDGTTVTGIGNILGSTGMDVGGGLNSKGGAANTNQDILRKLAADGTPLVVRIIGDVEGGDMYGLTAYDSIDYGGSVGDNGYMARMSSGRDITIEGIGFDATINGWGLHFICQTADYAAGYGRNFEVRNIAFKNVPEDCVGMEGQQEGSTLTAPVERCWVHHCSFYAPSIANPAESDKDGGDGACDFKRGQYFTNSYCYYEGYHKTNLVGSSDSSLQYHLTYHHNYWKNCESRGPLARQADIHMYNNIFEGQTSYCMNPRANAYIFSEYNMFVNSKNPVTVDSGAVKSYNDSFTSCTGDNNATVVTDRSTKVSSGNLYENFDTNSSLSYIPGGNYEIQESITDMKAVVMAYAGAQKETIISPEDYDTSVIPDDHMPTAAVALPYNQSLNKTYVAANGTKDNIVFNVAKFNSDSLTVGGTATGADIVFYVDSTVNITMTEVSGTYSPVLCNAAGESFITGNGTAENLPAGYYFIQSSGYDVGSSKYKEAKVASLSIVKAVTCTEHSYSSQVTAPTCTKGGYTTYTCTNCGYSYTGNETSAKGHTPGAAASCTSAQTCTVCGIELAPMTDHSYVGGTCSACGKVDPSTCEHPNASSVVTAPTCTATGYTTYNCPDCGHVYKDNYVNELGHTPGAAATCTTAQNCTVCDAVLTAALGHNYNANNICTVCGAENTAASGYEHNFTESGKTSAFYTITGNLSTSKGSVSYNGLTLTQCLKMESSTDICFNAPYAGKITLVFGGSTSASGKAVKIDETSYNADSNGIVTVEIAAGNHSVAKGDSINLFYIIYTPSATGGDVHTHSYTAVRQEPTCEGTGSITYTCSCGDTKTETIPSTGHQWNNASCTVAKTCTVCGEVGEAATGHSWKEATCTSPKTCTACGVTEGNALGHTSGSAATCTTAQTCTVCNAVLTAALGHNYSNGKCLVCGIEKSAFLDEGGWLEAAYAKWAAISGATGYHAYVSVSGANDWIKVDNYLIRQYSDGWRVDVVGLAAGSYQIKVVPVNGETENESAAIVSSPIAVKPHDRSGYAFVNGTSSGAYNEDGTLKANAVVVYVTEQNKNTVTATIDGTTYTGISNILAASVIKNSSVPICIRFVGNVTDLGTGDAFDKGDLLIDNQGNSIGLTIEGIGEDTVINGFGIRLKNSSNVEIRNLAVMNCNSSEGDNIGLQQNNNHIWIHNCDFFYGDAGSDADQAKGDGALDTKKSQYVTHSYNHFWDCGKVNLQGNGGDTSQYITYHHNWYDHCDSRMPRVREADTIHVYNNFYDGVSKYGIGATTGCSIFSEANYFLNTARPMMSSKQGTDALGEGTFSGETGGIIKSFNDVMINCGSFISYSQNNTSFDAYVATNRNETVPGSVVTLSGGTSYSNFDTASGFYTYNVETAEQAMQTVKDYAGRMNGGDFKWTFTDADNTSYDVNTELKSALTNYTTPIVTIGGVAGEEAGGGGQLPGGGETPDNPDNPDTPDTPVVPEGSYVHNFTESGLSSSFYTISGNLSSSKGTVSYAGLTLTQCLKIESSTTISFTAPAEGTLILVFVESSPNIKVDGTKVTGSSGVIEVKITAGSHTITKADTMNLFYMVYTPDNVCAHSYTESIVNNATCTTAGEMKYTCTLCGDSYTEAIEATGHDYESVVTAPTCTAGGYTTFTCSKCDDTYTGDNTAANGHSYSTSVTEPTCALPGSTKYTCTACGYNYSEPIAATGNHNYVYGECTVCGKVEVVHTHTWIAATCIAPKTCSSCGEVEGEKLGHNLSEDVKAHTCANSGYTTYTCTREGCDISYTANFTNATGEHNYVDGKCTVCNADQPAAGGTTASSQIHNFTDDGFTSTFYTFAGGQVTNGKHGKYTYDFGSGTETLNYALKFDSGGSAVFTPTADGTVTLAIAAEKGGRELSLTGTDGSSTEISVPSAKTLVVTTIDVKSGVTYTLVRTSGESGLYYIGYIPAAGGGDVHTHTYTANVTTQPGCLTTGIRTYTCSCGDSYTEVIPAKGHTEAIDALVVPTCTKTGLLTGSHCSVCDAVLVKQEVIPMVAHSYNAEITSPTCSTAGYTTYTCSCGDSYTDDPVPATGDHNYSEGICAVCGDKVDSEIDLQTAINKGGLVKVWGNIVLTEVFTSDTYKTTAYQQYHILVENITVTLDLNGYSIISGADKSANLFLIGTGANMTFKDSGNGYFDTNVYGGSVIRNFGGAVTVENGEFRGGNNTHYTVYTNGGTLEIQNATVYGGWGAVQIVNSAVATIHDGSYIVDDNNTSASQQNCVYVENSTLTVNGGSYTSTISKRGAAVVGEYGSTIIINDGEFNGPSMSVQSRAGTSITLNGGTFVNSFSYGGDTGPGAIYSKLGENASYVTLTAGMAAYSRSGVTVGTVHFVGKHALANAIAAANPGDIITLEKAHPLLASVVVPSNKTLTINLNGFVISGANITVDGVLVLEDSVGGGKVVAHIEKGENGFIMNAVSVGATTYVSFDLAYAAATRGETITLLSDVVLPDGFLFDKNITLCLGDCVLTNSAGDFAIENSLAEGYYVFTDDDGNYIISDRIIGEPVDPDQPGTDTPVDPDQPGTDTPVDPDQPGTDTPVDPDQPGTDTPVDPDQPDVDTPVAPDNGEVPGSEIAGGSDLPEIDNNEAPKAEKPLAGIVKSDRDKVVIAVAVCVALLIIPLALGIFRRRGFMW